MPKELPPYLGPPDWSFELAAASTPDAAASIALDIASGALVALRSELNTIKALSAHAESCLRAAVNAGVSVDTLATGLDLRPDHLQAVINGSQPLIPDIS